MTKSANLSLSDALRRQLKPWGINVSTIELAYDREVPNQEMNARYETMDKMTRSILEQWAETPDYVKLLYGTEYLEEIIIARLGRIAAMFKNDYDQVVESFLDAVRAEEPAIRYTPYAGYIAGLMAYLAQIVPTEWLDYYYFNSEKNAPKPSGLKKKKHKLDKNSKPNSN